MRWRFSVADEQMPTVTGPSPPPSIVVMPLAIAHGRPEQLDVLAAAHPAGHRSGPPEAGGGGALQRLGQAVVAGGVALGQAVQAVHAALAAEGDEVDLALVAGLEADGGAGGD